MSGDYAIRVEGLGKRYRVGANVGRHNSLRDVLAEKAASLFRRGPDPRTEFWALRDVAFEIARGENVGIIGLNGAGKSTLLKLLSRITEPTTGSARIGGRVGALLEVGTGFSGELTGRENTFLYGAILGMARAEIERKFDAIVAFSGIEKFIDTPVKRYSSGMYVRLAFSVAAHLEPDVLLLDEVLAVGDLAFQHKCLEFARRLQERDATVLFVSHSMHSIKSMCPRVIYMRKGQVAYDGPTDGGISLYETDSRLSTLSMAEGQPDKWPVVVDSVRISGVDGKEKTIFEMGERMRLSLDFEARESLNNPNFIVAFIRSDGVACCNFSTEVDGAPPGQVNGRGTLELVTPPLRLVSDMYTIHVLVRAKGFDEVLSSQVAGTFHIRHALFDRHFGVYHEPGKFVWGSNDTASEPLEQARAAEIP
jgi:lipopolysaccharide transport system ATP-binding protein